MMYGIQGWVDPIGAGKYRVTSGEGRRKAFKTDSGKMSSSNHLGIDMAAPKGTPVGSAMNGTVVSAGWINGYGNTVVVRAPDGTFVQYAHLDKINVAAGQQLSAGQNLGTVGSTGNSTGPHLDLIVSRNGQALKRDGTPHAKTKSWLTDGGKQAASYRPAAATPAAQQSEVALALNKLQGVQQQAQALSIPAPVEIPQVQPDVSVSSMQPVDIVAPIDVSPTASLDLLAAQNPSKDPLSNITINTTDSTQDWVDGLRYSLQANQYNADRNAAINRLISSEPLTEEEPAYGTIPESVTEYLNTLIDKA